MKAQKDKNVFKRIIRRITENTFVTVISTIIATLLLAILALAGNYVWHYIYDKEVTPTQIVSEEENLYSNFEKIIIGGSLQPIIQIFGTPTIYKRNLPDQFRVRNDSGKYEMKPVTTSLNSYKESIFVHTKYFLQIITDPNDIIIEYAITSRDEGLRPVIPLVVAVGSPDQTEITIDNPRVGEMTFKNLDRESSSYSDLKQKGLVDFNVLGWASIPSSYIEKHYYGAGNYDYILVSSTVDQANIYKFDTILGEQGKDSLLKNKEFLDWRLAAKPDCFAMVDGAEDELMQYLMSQGIGVSYREAAQFKD